MNNERWSGFLRSLHERRINADSARNDEFSEEIWRELSATGLFRILADDGSVGSNPLKRAVESMRELGKTSPDRGLTFSAVTQLASTIYCLRAYGSHELRSRYLPAAENGTAIGGHAITEENAGSDVMSMATTATLNGDHYVLHGEKRFITNAPVASTLVVYAKTIEGDRDLGLSAFLVETSWLGVSTSPAMPTVGLRTSPIGEVHLNGVKVPVENRIGHSGAGLLILDQVMKREILLAFSANIGEMEQIVERSVDYVNERQQFGTSIGTNQLVANRIVESRIAIELGGALIESVADKIDGYEDVTIPVAAAKIFISEANVTSALNAIQVHGGNGYLTTSSLHSDLLDAVPGAIYSGSNDLLRSKIATMMGILT